MRRLLLTFCTTLLAALDASSAAKPEDIAAPIDPYAISFAAPAAWAKEGSFKGLCARGGFEVDCVWKDGRPVRVTVRSKCGGKADVRFKGEKIPYDAGGFNK